MKEKTKKVLNLFLHYRITTVVGAWVYYFISAVIPLAFLLITAFNLFGVSIAGEFVARLPKEFKLAGETIASTAENATKSVTVFFVISVIFSCSALLNQMSKDGDYMFNIPSRKKRGLFRRLWAVIALCALFVIFLGSALVFSFGSTVLGGIRTTGFNKMLLTLLTFFVIISLSYAVIILLYRFVSPIKLKFKTLAIGGFCSLAIAVLGTIGLSVYLRFFKPYNAFYGSLTAILIFLLWAYIVMVGLVIGVVVNVEIYKRNLSSVKGN